VIVKHSSEISKSAYNTGLAKVAVQCSADTFVVNQTLFSASRFVVKIATFAKPETVNRNLQNANWFIVQLQLRIRREGAQSDK